ncbi:uncharacterized protein SAPINGB_P004872 [Magnusiomyces paraingens]|uniref:Uncharacterized protein n=1 Tax=Magnusiomyces paraingens TaxID=2606893 RepID=A0A5E8BXI3_9ASCO|nr:uncharacterized protein SAPINGB_P004872 [Saprochaete ingens]VVT56164.1 unnamed protein product [Saprochaete ingens]
MLGLGNSGGILSLVTPQGKVPGTGLSEIVKNLNSYASDPTASLLFGTGSNVINDILNLVGAELPGQWGDYSANSDIGPSVFFVVAFSIFTASYIFIFTRNCMRGHIFFPTLGLIIYSLLRAIAFGLRVNWSKNPTNIDLGMTSSGLIFGPGIFICVTNMLFGLRIFTWRHPEFNKNIVFNGAVFFVNMAIIGMFIMGLSGEGLPFANFMTRHRYTVCQRLGSAGAVATALYTMMGVGLIVLGYVIKPGHIEGRLGLVCGRFGSRRNGMNTPLQTFSAGWVRSADLFFYPAKGSQVRYTRGESESRAVRVIATRKAPAGGLSTHTFGSGYQGSSGHGPRMSTNIWIVVVTSVLLCIGASLRAASTFPRTARGGFNGVPTGSWMYLSWPMYVFTGAFECIINIIYLAGRVDLRFYIPDMPRKVGDGPIEGDSQNDVELESYMLQNQSKPELVRVVE